MGQKPHDHVPDEGPIIFRRYVKLPDGRVLDAQKYGHKAWPIRVKKP